MPSVGDHPGKAGPRTAGDGVAECGYVGAMSRPELPAPPQDRASALPTVVIPGLTRDPFQIVGRACSMIPAVGGVGVPPQINPSVQTTISPEIWSKARFSAAT